MDKRLNKQSSQKEIDSSKTKVFSSYSKARTDSNNFRVNIMKNNEKKYDPEISNINLMKIKHIEDMRKNLMSYKLLQDKKMFLNISNTSNMINSCNFILFGPSGSGKSSFIKTLYKALYGTSILPPDAVNKLVVKAFDENEGTLNFTRLHLKEESDGSFGITICDTRGHITMNNSEKEQFKVIIDGNVKNGSKVEQLDNRNPLMLWEFWKKDVELFPKDIFFANSNNKLTIQRIPHCICFVLDGASDEVIDEEDAKFYKDLYELSLSKGYLNIHVILTRIDLLEKVSQNAEEVKDKKIERVIEILNVKRSNIHFIENYHSNINENIIEIDYHVLKSLLEMINSAEQFLLYYFNRNATCFAKCF